MPAYGPSCSLPSQFTPSIPEKDDQTLFEATCRLVGCHHASKTNVSHLLYPSVDVELCAIDRALAQHIPSLEVQQRMEGQQQESSGAADQAPGWLQLPVALLSAGRRAVLSRLPGPWHVLRHEPPPPQLLAWSHSQPLLAVGHSASGAVLLYNCSQPTAGAAADAGGSPGSLQQSQHVLVHQLQQQVSTLAWRPVHSSMLAVGCCGGVALWNLGKLPLSAAAMHRGAEGSRSSTAAWVTFLSFRAGCRVSSLTWSPDGTRLAGSSLDCNRLMVWDVALGVGAKLRLGVVPVHQLCWSPDGNYLFAADRSGQFFLYETATWALRQWVSPPGSAVSGAAWAPDSSVLLLSMSGSNFLVGLHLVGAPAKLTEQMLPVALPGVSDRELTMDLPGPTDSQPKAVQSSISSICWDPTGNRLAVLLQGHHPAAGTVALFSTTFTPVVTCNLIGYVQPGPVPKSALAGGDAEVDSSSGGMAGGGWQLQAVFAPVPGRADAAGLLSVGQRGTSGEICRVVNVPLYY